MVGRVSAKRVTRHRRAYGQASARSQKFYRLPKIRGLSCLRTSTSTLATLTRYRTVLLRALASSEPISLLPRDPISGGSGRAGRWGSIEGDPAMRILRRRAVRSDSNEIAAHTGLHSHGGVTTIVSAIALLFSAYSLWELSLKQADLTPYVTGVVTYERDRTASLSIQPDGGFEVLAVPITIANGGARDGAVLALRLDVKNLSTGLTARFEATYTVDATYFAAKGDRRPKTPFSALVIAGRTAWTGTVLFYPVSYSDQRALTPIAQIREFYQAMRTKYAKELDGASSISVLRDKFPNLPEFADADAFEAKVLQPKGKGDMTLEARQSRPERLARPRAWHDSTADHDHLADAGCIGIYHAERRARTGSDGGRGTVRLPKSLRRSTRMRQPRPVELGQVLSRHNGSIFAGGWLLYFALLMAGGSGAAALAGKWGEAGAAFCVSAPLLFTSAGAGGTRASRSTSVASSGSAAGGARWCAGRTWRPRG